MNEPIDRISSLPDDVLTHVLSFASAKEVVQTRILSRRWRDVWANVPVLIFDLNEFLDVDTDDYVLDGENLHFDHFVIWVLKNRGPSRLDTIVYDWGFETDSCEPSMEWLDHAALLNPRVISVCIWDLYGIEELKVPDSLFSCASLEELELSISTSGETKIKPKSINLPSLKILKLAKLGLNNKFARKLFLGCPSLEILEIDQCILRILEISSNVLKELTIDGLWTMQHMRICCPNLVSLFLKSSMNNIRSISLVNMSSLVNADIDLGGDDEEFYDDLSDINVLSGLSNTTSLKLQLDRNVDSKEQWEKDISECGIFKNLKNLEVGSWDIIADFDLVACFLEHSPVLQELTFNLRCIKSIVDAQEAPGQHGFFQLEYLETVKVNCRKKKEMARELIISLFGGYIKNISNVIIT